VLIEDFDRRRDILECKKDETRKEEPDLGGNKGADDAGIGFILLKERGGDNDSAALKVRKGEAVDNAGWVYLGR
jgi:hypothetical protein